MRVGIPIFGCDSGRSGIGRYAGKIIAAMAAESEAIRIEVLGCPSDLAALAPQRPNVHHLPLPDVPLAPAANALWHLARLPALCRERRYDVLFLPAGNRRLVWSAPCPTVATVHDLSSLHVRGKYDFVRSAYIGLALPKLIARLTHVITVSEASRRDIVGLTGLDEDDVTVIPNGTDLEMFRPGNPLRARQRTAGVLGGEEPYLLYVSRVEHPGKNHAGLIAAYTRWRDLFGRKHKLVLAGPDWDRAKEVHACAQSSRYHDDIVFTGFVDDALLPELYRGSDAFVFPSLWEGFGIPLLEAMASGTPIACGDRSSLPEVAGDAALYFDPQDMDDMAYALERVVGDTKLRETLRERGLRRVRRFSWDTAGRATLSVLEKSVAKSQYGTKPCVV